MPSQDREDRIVVSIWIPSKLRTDAASGSAEVPFYDLMVVAGDVADRLDNVVAKLVALHDLTGKPILFVPGNRDLCGARLRAGEFHHLPAEIIVLETGSSAFFGGVQFIGSTLWTDFELTGTEYASQKWAIAAMPEYFSVRHSCEDRLIRPIDTANEHMRDKAKLAQALSHPHQGATVVVTHHAPSIRSLPKDVQYDISCAAFASNLETLIERYQPALWIHAPIYADVDYRIGSTRVVSSAGGCFCEVDPEGPRDELVVTLG